MKQLNLNPRGFFIKEGEKVLQKRRIINTIANVLIQEGYHEIELPTFEYLDEYNDVVDSSDYVVDKLDNSGKAVIVRPTGFYTVLGLADLNPDLQDHKIFWQCQCFRNNTPASRSQFRELTELGFAVLNPTEKMKDYVHISLKLILDKYDLNLEIIEVNHDECKSYHYHHEKYGKIATCITMSLMDEAFIHLDRLVAAHIENLAND